MATAEVPKLKAALHGCGVALERLSDSSTCYTLQTQLLLSDRFGESELATLCYCHLTEYYDNGDN